MKNGTKPELPVFGFAPLDADNRNRTCTVSHQNLNLARLPIPPYPQDLKLFHIVSERVGVVNKGEGNSFAGIVSKLNI